MSHTPAARPRLGVERLEDRTTPATLPAGFTESVVASGLSGPTAMEIAPNGDLWVIEQTGAVKRFRPGGTTADVVADLSAVGLLTEDEQGVLGIAFAPDFATSKALYLNYTSSDPPAARNRVSRFTVNDSNPADYSLVDTPGNPALLDETVVLDLDPIEAAYHNGGAIHFGPDGKLYVATGDNSRATSSQALTNLHGKILRVNPDGSIPADNPTTFSGVTGTTTGPNRAIWALGLRNPFTFTFDPATGTMFINDVGPDTFEEVNVGGAGRNFGWPNTEGDFPQSAFPGLTRPRYTYTHGRGALQGFAITGGAFYSPAAAQFPSEFAGDYFFADFVNGWIDVIDANGADAREFASGIGGPVDLRVAADGTLYYLARATGQAFRVSFTGSAAAAVTQHPQDATGSLGGSVSFTAAASGAAPVAFRWQKLVGTTFTDLADGDGVSGATTSRLTLSGLTDAAAGQYRVVVTNSLGSDTSDAATLAVVANQPPTAAIMLTSGLVNGRFVAGRAVTFAGTGDDPETGTLGAASFTWKVEYVTSIASGNPAVRPFVQEFSGQAGGTFTPSAVGPYKLTDVVYRITLTARDDAGLTATRVFDIAPNVTRITVRGTPVALRLTVDGQPVASGTTVPSVVGFRRVIGGPVVRTYNGFRFRFLGWSDGGAATHVVTAPFAPTVYVARYAVTRVR